MKKIIFVLILVIPFFGFSQSTGAKVEIEENEKLLETEDYTFYLESNLLTVIKRLDKPMNFRTSKYLIQGYNVGHGFRQWNLGNKQVFYLEDTMFFYCYLDTYLTCVSEKIKK